MTDALRRAAGELRYLLERGYPQEASLTLVGNRHNLPAPEREILRRGVVAPKVAEVRRAKLMTLGELEGLRLAVDGHNQLITLESALRGGPLLIADDGLVRDIARAAAGYRLGEVSRKALGLLIEALAGAAPESVLFLFDAPISRSGELAALVRQALAEAGLTGDARTAAYPEVELERHEGPVATADGALIDRCARVIDLAGQIISERFGHLLTSLEAP